MLNKKFWVLSFLCLPLYVCAQSEKASDTTKAVVDSDSLEPFVVRTDLVTMNSIDKVVVSEGHQLGTVVQDLPGMSIQRTGANTAKPVSHGVTGLRLGIMQNGMLVFGQPWGQDHAPEVGALGASRISVYRGISTFRHTSSALGGIINVDQSTRVDTSFHGLISIYGGTNPQGGGGELALQGRVSKDSDVYWMITGGGARHGSGYSPNYILNNTGYATYNGRIAFGKFGDRSVWNLSLSRYYNRAGLLEASATEDSVEFDELINSGQPDHFDEFTYKISDPSTEVIHDAFQFKGAKFLSDRNMLKWNLTMQSDLRREWEGHEHGDSLVADENPTHEIALNTIRLDLLDQYTFLGLNIITGVNLTSMINVFEYEPLIPAYDEFRGGAFVQAGTQLSKGGKSFSATGILRGDMNRLLSLDSLWTHPESRLMRRGLSGGLELGYSRYEVWSYELFVGRFWRPAAPNELFSQGVHFGAASLELGEVNLSSESGTKFRLDILRWLKTGKTRLTLMATGYINYFENFIYLEPAGYSTTDEGTFQAYKYTNSRAWIGGNDLTFQLTHPKIRWKGTVGWSMGKDLDQDVPIWSVPAGNFSSKATLFYQLNTKIAIEPSISVNGEIRKQEWPQEFVLTPPPDSYALLNLSVDTRIGEIISIGLTAKNILNTEWRSYLDRFRYFAAMPGRNILMSVKFDF